MPVYGNGGEGAREKFFVVTTYRFATDGEPIPDMPTTGPCREWDGRPCRIEHHHQRERTTGPRFSLTVVLCKAHRRAFTLYPPGHVPYGRRAIAPVASDGGPVRRSGNATRKCRISDCADTYFDAALDGADGRAWPREYKPGGSGRWWGVQVRKLARATHWLGVDPVDPPRHTEAIATALALDTLLLTEQKKLIAAHPGYRARSRAVRSVLSALIRRPVVPADRLAAAGFIAGLWGTPFRWDPSPGVLRPLAFRPGSPPPRARDP